MKIRPLSGFPEWLPRERLIEERVIRAISRVFELYGFSNIETRAVERVSQLIGGGDTGKQIYGLHRLNGAEEAADELGLRFDLTVPFARYVLENQGRIPLPFKRYQIQKVWRGERAQEGRYREFYQADADLVALDHLPLQVDAEMLELLHAAVSEMPVPAFRIHINNRKLMEGLYQGLGVTDTKAALRSLDKLDKIGEAKLGRELREQQGFSEQQVSTALAAAKIKSTSLDFADQVRALGVKGELLEEGLGELGTVLEGTSLLPEGAIVVDLRIARGLDYYTGTVLEGFVDDFPELGSICSGGRYENLTQDLGSKEKLPGMGVSVGVSRLLGKLLGSGRLSASRGSPAVVLVAVADEASRLQAKRVAAQLRQRGIAADVFLGEAKFGKQIKYASTRGIPYVWFPAVGDATSDEVRDLQSGEQGAADAGDWAAPPLALEPQVLLDGAPWGR